MIPQTTHVGMMLLFALCTATVFAALLRDDPREQVRIGARIFGGLIIGAYVVGWLMYGLPG